MLIIMKADTSRYQCRSKMGPRIQVTDSEGPGNGEMERMRERIELQMTQSFLC